MVPQRKPTALSGAQPKKQRSVPIAEEKKKSLDLLRNGMLILHVALPKGFLRVILTIGTFHLTYWCESPISM
jgi:hypothetical protein